MTDLPESLFANPMWHALQTSHRRFAATAGDACRYPADVAPFAAVAAPSTVAMRHLHSLLEPAESLWIMGESFPAVPELRCGETMDCLQMVLPAEVTPPGPSVEIVQLTAANAAEMVSLTSLAFPGFFRSRTHEMGSYYGIRSGGELVAMGGERFLLDGYPEISGVCTHPAHRGKSYAVSLIWQLARNHRRDGLISWLHVGAANRRAIDLYRWMGFQVVRGVKIHRVSRND